MKFTYINLEFDKEKSIIGFMNKESKLEIEDHSGFEVDCLLICDNSHQIEIGDKKDAAIIFSKLTEALIHLRMLPLEE